MLRNLGVWNRLAVVAAVLCALTVVSYRANGVHSYAVSLTAAKCAAMPAVPGNIFAELDCEAKPDWGHEIFMQLGALPAGIFNAALISAGAYAAIWLSVWAYRWVLRGKRVSPAE
jgi:hypothetical protein